MTPSEVRDLETIVTRLRRNVAQAKMDNRSPHNTYSWGLADGLEIAYEMIKAFQDKYPKEKLERIDEGR